MIEVVNKYYIQRLYAHELKWSDWCHAVFYGSYHGMSPIPFYYVKQKGTTAKIDLKQDLSTLFSSLKSNVRNEIRRAEREGCQVGYSRDYELFRQYYNGFSDKKKSIQPISLSQISKYGNAVVSSVKYGEKTLAMHVSVCDEDNKMVFLLYSASLRLEEDADRNLVGRANRYLHWSEFNHYKSLGYEFYDMNGVCIDPSDEERYKIGRFKLSLGGVLEERVDLYSPFFALMVVLKNGWHCLSFVFRKR